MIFELIRQPVTEFACQEAAHGSTLFLTMCAEQPSPAPGSRGGFRFAAVAWEAGLFGVGSNQSLPNARGQCRFEK